MGHSEPAALPAEAASETPLRGSRRVATSASAAVRPIRVLHGPVNVGNQPWVLSRHERALGATSDLVVNYHTWLGYSADRCLSGLASRTPRALASRLVFGASAPFRYDVLHYYFGLSFLSWNDYGTRNRLWFKDLELARLLGRKIFMTLQGCDVRLSADSARRNRFTPCSEGHCPSQPSCLAVLDQQRRFLIEHVLPRVDRAFVLNPELAHYVPHAAFLPYASVEIDHYTPEYPTTSGPIRIVHAPTDPGIKGSPYIIRAVERLQQRYPIEFTLVQNVPHAQALEIYRKADLVIDQVLTGWYGGFAVEAMAMGKPVACYVRTEDLGFVPAAMAASLPFFRIAPVTIEQDLEAALLQRDRWVEAGRRARAYVERWHDPRRIAGAMLDAYRHPESRFELPLV